MAVSQRAAVLKDLETRRELRMEAKLLRARLREIQPQIDALASNAIAQTHGVSIRFVNTVAASIPWTDDEQPAESGLARYYG